ncbi:uncharacterized protein LOC107361584 [Tetranychus urticae]|uniref:F-box domain-containing protein n=1 Tax=Tetranychus urticae TaxID=32264 RepID=T1K894_TETUR|nr:uncharacterized protein LOC107361584 [Tetranychus urticae]XP_025016490.1 uncharacterized protein LOC107361584 [Tetranychus urticae]
MNIDELPDDCLLCIFNHFEEFQTLLNVSEVCERWRGLVLERLRKVQYLTDDDELLGHPTGNAIVFENNEQLEGFKLSKWFPNLKILDVHEDLDVNIVANLRVKGLILKFYAHLEVLDNITFNNPSLEMLSISRFCSFFANDIQGPMLKQLCITDCNVTDFAFHAEYFPNLERLRIDAIACNHDDISITPRPVLKKLEILEICNDEAYRRGSYRGFRLADFCPALKSAFHYLRNRGTIGIESETENHFLEDLVLEFEKRQLWSDLREILKKYPNLKHLAIRGGDAISDENIPELLELLPRLVLIDIRESEKVTEKSTKYIDWYCEHHNRSISFYCQADETEITKKWPHLSTKRVSIGRGFDFMKNCFLKNHSDLPYLLDPVE